MKPMLDIKDLVISYQKEHPVVKNVTFTLASGEVVGLVGGSGSGKSTLARAITRLARPQSGRIFLQGKNILNMKSRELYQIVQMIFQQPDASFDPRRTIEKSLQEGIKTPVQWETLLAQCQLDPSLLKRYPHELSGGQCQRAAIARALLHQPELLILDEATSALDLITQKAIMELLMEIQRTTHMSYLLITHDFNLVHH